jgi:tetratricopeptide (TPR) repeat protein
LDAALAIDSTFDYAYKVKSIAYLKSGDFIEWKRLMDKAVGLDPKAHLRYRGWCRFQFFRDYEGAIKDIERLDSLFVSDIGYSQNGTYHLKVALGLCYKMLGNTDKAISLISEQIKKNEEINFVGEYDYLHLGVLYLHKGAYEKALWAFQSQSKESELSENQYYLALTYKALQQTENFRNAILKAKELEIANAQNSQYTRE